MKPIGDRTLSVDYWAIGLQTVKTAWRSASLTRISAKESNLHIQGRSRTRSIHKPEARPIGKNFASSHLLLLSLWNSLQYVIVQKRQSCLAYIFWLGFFFWLFFFKHFTYQGPLKRLVVSFVVFRAWDFCPKPALVLEFDMELSTPLQKLEGFLHPSIFCHPGGFFSKSAFVP